MEPMALGSPVGSPNSPGGATSPYLPSFLMGEREQGACVPMSNKSPSRLARHLSFSSPTTSLTPAFSGPTPGTQGSAPRPERATGPPTRGLFDEIPSKRFESSLLTHPNTSVFSIDPGSPDTEASCWVTVFGFPPSSASVILAQFASYGHIVETRSSRGTNWVHVRYQARPEATRAIANHAKVFGDSIMIGVVPCRDQEIIGSESQQKENLNQADTPRPMHNAFLNSGHRDSPFTSPGFKPGTPGSPGYCVTSPMRGNSGNVRPLVQAYHLAQHDSEVIMSRNIPQKSSSMVTKAWEFLGW